LHKINPFGRLPQGPRSALERFRRSRYSGAMPSLQGLLLHHLSGWHGIQHHRQQPVRRRGASSQVG
jgi:hypothetical protein